MSKRGNFPGKAAHEEFAIVELRPLDRHILQIRMQDRASKNTFSEALTRGLSAAFAEAGRHPDCKVVILTGYDKYFASGITPETSPGLADGAVADHDPCSLVLRCPVPVISAMQGHGIGGGFVLGLFADIVVLSRESIYTANLMRNDSAPGMSATRILAQKLGVGLASEMMLSASNYRGKELQERGVPFTVLPRAKVLAHALEFAKTLAEKPRTALVALKEHLNAPLREALPDMFA